MAALEITAFGHAAIGFDRGGRRLLIDPGFLSDPTAIDTADVVLITHEHADHFSVDALTAALRAHADLEVRGPGPVARRLAEAGAPAERVHEVTDGTEFTAAGLSVRAIGREHAVVHPNIPRVANVGYLVEGAAYHPGDSFAAIPEVGPVEVLFVPISAPWLKLAESIDYLRAVEPAVAVPIHDAFLSEPGKAVADRLVTSLAGAAEYRRLGLGESLAPTT